jgi:hypothetical protein
MLIAELRAKISGGAPPSDRLKDVLTLHVFSPLRYFGIVEELIDFLEAARNVSGDRLGLRPVEGVETFFWPRLALGGRRREPDVLLLVSHGGTRRTAIVVEAKYQSGPSDLEMVDGAKGDVVDNESVGISGDQLADDFLALKHGEWWCFQERALPRPVSLMAEDTRRVLYVTTHYEMPVDVIRRAIEAVGADEARLAEQSLFWVGWRELARILEETARSARDVGPLSRLLRDVHGVLKLRRLEPFRGIARELPAVFPYTRALAPRETWQNLVPVGEYESLFAQRRTAFRQT